MTSEILFSRRTFAGARFAEPETYNVAQAMVRAVLTECQTSDCDVKCRIIFIT